MKLPLPSNMLFLILCVVSTLATAGQPDQPQSGLTWATPAIREMQEDDFANPAMFWLDKGKSLFRAEQGAAGTSCSTCHSSSGSAGDLNGSGTDFPKVVDGQLLNLEGQINRCRTERMQAAQFPLESEQLLSLVMYVRSLSAGQAVDVRVDGQAEPYFERGRVLYHQRRGQMNLACAQCHDDRPGLWVRGEQLSQGQINNFPAYLVRWSGVGSTHRRFQFCDDQRVAEPLAIGSDDYLALELYVAWRGNGLPVEVPAVRR